MKLVEKLKEKAKYIYYTVATSMLMFMVSPQVAYAAEDGSNYILNSNIVQAFIKLLKDTTSVLLIILPLTAALVFLYLCVRQYFADEQEKPKFANQKKYILPILIPAECISGIIVILSSYFAFSTQ